MAAMKPAAGKPGLEEEGSQIHRIRITLTSRNVKNLEKGGPAFLVSSLVTSSVLLASLKDFVRDVRHIHIFLLLLL